MQSRFGISHSKGRRHTIHTGRNRCHCLTLSDSRSSLEPEEGYQPCQLRPRQSHRAVHSLPFGAPRPKTHQCAGESALTPSIGSAPITAFHPTFPSPDVYVGILSMMFSHPGFYCVVAESDGCMVGSNCLDERSAIA